MVYTVDPRFIPPHQGFYCLRTIYTVHPRFILSTHGLYRLTSVYNVHPRFILSTHGLYRLTSVYTVSTCKTVFTNTGEIYLNKESVLLLCKRKKKAKREPRETENDQTNELTLKQIDKQTEKYNKIYYIAQ